MHGLDGLSYLIKMATKVFLVKFDGYWHWAIVAFMLATITMYPFGSTFH